MKERKFIPVAVGSVPQPDPYIFKDGDSYYLYATGRDGVTVFKADSLNNFEYVKVALCAEGQKEYWAPAVFKSDSKYYMYYSSMPTVSDDVHTQQIRLAIGNTPLDFKFEKNLIEPFSIDPHVVRNGVGKNYMFYSVNSYDAKRVGTYIVCDEMAGETEMQGKPALAVAPTIDEEIFMRNRFKEGEHWHTLEGAFYFHHDNYHYLMYSGNCFENENYYIGYASVKGEPTDNLNELKWEKKPDENTYLPVIKSRDNIEGTGHNSVISDKGEVYIVFHAREKSANKDGESRVAFIERLKVGGGKISLA